MIFEVGKKVYAWGKDDFVYSPEGEAIIGTITEVSHDSCWIESIVDDEKYFIAKYKIYEVGSGPVKDHTPIYNVDEIFQEDPDDENFCILTLPPHIIAATDFEIGDDLNITTDGESITIRKKEKEYE